ncbi:hypothetical protein ACJX0J_024287, partial [Zea mays]
TNKTPFTAIFYRSVNMLHYTTLSIYIRHLLVIDGDGGYKLLTSICVFFLNFSMCKVAKLYSTLKRIAQTTRQEEIQGTRYYYGVRAYDLPDQRHSTQTGDVEE